MTEQPEALRLADRLTLKDYYEFDAGLYCPQAAAELRRLHEEVTEQARLLGISAERELSLLARIDRLEKLNAEMLEAIRAFADANDWAAASWKKQPHIAPLFKIAEENRND